MAQQNYSNGQSGFLVSDLITRAKLGNISTTFLLQSAQMALAAYAKAYNGDYYKVASQASAPTVFPSAQSALTPGSFYEISYPADAQDVGITDIQILWDTSNLKVLDQALIVEQDDETQWDVKTSNTTTVYWRTAGRKIRLYVPLAYLGTTPKYTLGYLRYPTYPGLVGDTLDVPAEDFQTFYRTWQGVL